MCLRNTLYFAKSQWFLVWNCSKTQKALHGAGFETLRGHDGSAIFGDSRKRGSTTSANTCNVVKKLRHQDNLGAHLGLSASACPFFLEEVLCRLLIKVRSCLTWSMPCSKNEAGKKTTGSPITPSWQTRTHIGKEMSASLLTRTSWVLWLTPEELDMREDRKPQTLNPSLSLSTVARLRRPVLLRKRRYVPLDLCWPCSLTHRLCLFLTISPCLSPSLFRHQASSRYDPAERNDDCVQAQPGRAPGGCEATSYTVVNWEMKNVPSGPSCASWMQGPPLPRAHVRRRVAFLGAWGGRQNCFAALAHLRCCLGTRCNPKDWDKWRGNVSSSSSGPHNLDKPGGLLDYGRQGSACPLFKNTRTMRGATSSRLHCLNHDTSRGLARWCSEKECAALRQNSSHKVCAAFPDAHERYPGQAS